MPLDLQGIQMTKTFRNLVIFSIVAVSIGWMAAWVNTQILSPVS
jgi:hypothetical protein